LHARGVRATLCDVRSYVGTNVRRPEGPAKVAGRARYVADLDVPGAWVGGAVRSPVACGVLEGFDRDAGFDFSRVIVIGPGDIPGDNVVALIADDQPILCARDIEHFGEPLLLVAAPDRALLLDAISAIRPRILLREPVLDMESSQRVFKELRIEKGCSTWLVDRLAIDAGRASDAIAHRGAILVEGEYRTDSQEQLYIEPQGAIAWPADASGDLLVKGSLQCPHYVRKALARAFGIAPERARVVQAETGGGFGGKEEYPSIVACHAALLARAAKRPVKVIYERHEDLAVTPKRHPSRVRHRTLATRDGDLLAMDVDILMDGGAYTTLSPVVLSRGAIHAAGPYRCDNVSIRARVVATNHVPYGAFRGFGAPQTCFAIERQMDRIARAVGMHPAELRRRNMLRAGDTTATGQVLRESVGSELVMERILARSRFHEHDWCRSAPLARSPLVPRKRRGVGMSFFFHGAGFTGSGEEMLKGRVRVTVADDGCIELQAGSTEIGQGTNAMFVAIAAESLGVSLDDVRLVEPDTARVPDSGPTVASRTCMIVGGCLARACREIAQRIGGGPQPFRERARAFVARGGDRFVTVVYGSPPGLAWDEATYRGDAYPVFGWAADVAEVLVDMDTFEVEVTRLLTTVDVGRAIQPQLVEGQIEGGSLQAVGFAHLEVVGAEDGRFLQDRLATCVIPTTLDAPRIEVELVEVPYSHGPFGAKGVGELPMDGGAPAIASAIEDALGIRVDRIPATPERLLEAWRRAHGDERA
jgi:CO/xanthine dehydrogenase Mo-binding subunit